MGDFKYDVFLSYKRADAEWAERMRRSLAAAKLTAFQDVQDLRAGPEWLQQLKDVIPTCRHLVLLWSAKTELEIGDVISKELDFFQFHAGKDWGCSRRMVMVLLDQAPPPKSFYSTHGHSIKDLIGRPVTACAEVTTEEWSKVVDKVVRDLREGEERRPVNLLVLTTSALWWPKNLEARPGFAPATVNEFLKNLALTNPESPNVFAQFVQRYGQTMDTAMAWRPFGNEGPPVDQIVADLQADINDWAAEFDQKGYVFQEVSKDIWSPELADAQRIINKLAAELSLIIVDPLSLHDETIRRLAERLDPCFQSTKCVVVTLGPSGWTDGSPKTIRNQLKGLSKEVYSHLYSPKFPPTMGAHSAPQVGNLDMLKRLVLFAIGVDSAGRKRAPRILKN